MTVWTVWKGYYSDQVMDAVFSTKEKAEQYIELMKHLDNDYNDFPEEYVVDQPKKENERVSIRITKSGEVLHGYGLYFYAGKEEVEERKDHFIVWVNFQYDYDRMVKAARDKLAEYKAREAGI